MTSRAVRAKLTFLFGGISSYTNGGSSGMRQPAGLLSQVRQPLDSSGRNNHIATHQWVDARGNLRYVAEHSGVTGSLTVQAVTQYTYDVRGQLVAVEDELGNTTSLTYDKFGRKTAMSDPDMGSWSYKYDASGNLIFQKDARSQRLCFYYDAQNRLTTKATHTSDTCPAKPGPTHASVLATYTYTATNGLGQLASSTWRRTSSAFDNESFTYDSRGRLATHTRNIDGRSYSQTVQAYDTLNRPTQVIYPGGQTVNVGYDREGEETLTVAGTALVSAMKYNERGQLTLINRSNTTHNVSFSYHGAANNFRLQAISTPNIFVQGNITYDNVGNISGFTRQVRTQAVETLTFTYDALNRLTNAESTGNSAVAYNDSFDYDPIGNLTSFDGVNQSYTTGGTRPHAVTIVGDRSYFYDANGNLTRIDNDYVTERTLGWNAENRLTSVTESGQTTQFRYDPAGIRTTVIYPDGSKLIQPFPHYEEERSAGGTLLKQRTSYTLGGRLIALEQDDTLFYAHTDHLGSPAALMQKQGEVFVSSSIARYKPYGGYLTEPTATALDRGYTGHDRTAADDGLGLVYMNARYLDPGTGRFISADTLVPEPGNPQAFNRYSYALGNPVGLVDPSGHCAGEYNSSTGVATQDQACWDYLFNEFCQGGICKGDDWMNRLVFGGYWDDIAGTVFYYFDVAWTIDELRILQGALQNVTSALNGQGYAGGTIIENIKYAKRHSSRTDSITFPGTVVWLRYITEQYIWHETGHAISFQNSRRPQRAMLQFANSSDGGVCMPAGSSHCVSGVTAGQYCYREYCSRQYGVLAVYTGNTPELWADGFAAWVYHQTYGGVPPSSWVRATTDATRYRQAQWWMIFKAVEYALAATFH